MLKKGGRLSEMIHLQSDDGHLVTVHIPRIKRDQKGKANTDNQFELEANAEHLIACWNACDGINPEAVPGLLGALKAFVRNRATCPTSNGKDLEAWEMMKEAIANAPPK